MRGHWKRGCEGTDTPVFSQSDHLSISKSHQILNGSNVGERYSTQGAKVFQEKKGVYQKSVKTFRILTGGGESLVCHFQVPVGVFRKTNCDFFFLPITIFNFIRELL